MRRHRSGRSRERSGIDGSLELTLRVPLTLTEGGTRIEGNRRGGETGGGRGGETIVGLRVVSRLLVVRIGHREVDLGL